MKPDALPALSLLIVDDDKMIGEMIGLIIGRTFPGVVIHLAENGKQGVELFKMHLPDIVITDINMPVMGGIQMTSEIKSVKKDTPFIVLTGNSDRNSLDKFSGLGVNDYIEKPIEFAKLFTAIKSTLLGSGRNGGASDAPPAGTDSPSPSGRDTVVEAKHF